MKKRIKTPTCLNCGSELKPEDNFCPACGQENDNKRQSFGHMMVDMITNFMSLDSKFAKSIPAILFKPGYLTLEFIKGKRASYLAPARMFLTIVVVYFLLSSIKGGEPVIISNESKDSLPEKTVLIQEGPMNFRITNDSGDTILTHDPEEVLNSTEMEKTKFAKIRRLVKSGITDTGQVMDSIYVSNTFWNRFYYTQAIKLAGTEYEDLKSYFKSKLPWIFFLLMPVFALLLKLLYIRRKYLYIDHLVFAFHLHTFYFLLATLSLITIWITGININLIVIIISVIYTVIALLKFYRQGIAKTLFKMVLIFFLYTISALFSVIFILFIMFLLY